MQANRAVSFSRKTAYGFGAVAFGVKNNGFDYFFLIFYSQVMGVSAYLVSLALMIALIVDDPFSVIAADVIDAITESSKAMIFTNRPV